MEATSFTLLERVKDVGDDGAWESFFNHYSPLILSYARKKGCTQDLAHEVLQETMVALLRVMPSFSYERSKGQFRSYLLKIVTTRITDAFRRQRANQRLIDGYHDIELSMVEDSGEGPAALWDDQWDLNLVRRAMKQTLMRVNLLTARSFELYVMQRLPVDEVADRLAVSANAVYQHRSRFIGILKEELDHLRKEYGE